MNPNSSYQHNPFDDLMNEPVNTGNPFAMGNTNGNFANGQNTESSTGYTPKAMDDGKLNDLINPFAVLGMENPSAPKEKASNGPKQASLMEVQQQQQQQPLQRPSMMPSQPFGQSPFQPNVPIAPPVNSFSDPFSAFNQPVPNKSQDVNNGINIDPFSSFQVPAPSVSNVRNPSPAVNFNVNLNVNSSTNNASTNNGFGNDPFGSDPFSTNTTMINNNNNNNNNNVNPTSSTASSNNNNGFATDFSDFDAFPTTTKEQENLDDEDDFGITWDSPRLTAKNKTDTEDNEVEEVVIEEDNDKGVNSSHERSESKNGISPAKYMNTNRYSDNDRTQNDEKLEGYILARISTRTLLVKEWKKTYWVILKEQSRLLLYRNREDYLYSPVGQNVKKEHLLSANIKCSEITCKEYSGYGDLYHFTVEELMDYGPVLVAKFSTLELTPLRSFRAAIMDIVIAQRKKLLELNSQRTRNGSFVHAERTAREGKIPARRSQNTAQQPKHSGDATTQKEKEKTAVKEDKYAKWGTIDNID